MQNNIVSTFSEVKILLKEYALHIISAVCIFVQVYVLVKFVYMIEGYYYSAEVSYGVYESVKTAGKDWSEMPFPASKYDLLWAFFLLYSITALAVVCTTYNKRTHRILTAISVALTVFAVVCLVVAV
ncbi:MAG: hypothetical protein LBL41_01825 [Bifidobacteriaceae bacterium]|jgi:hypothetical protein|nr:hypothetical protein [Bifidobacteriaceae bacterium]